MTEDVAATVVERAAGRGMHAGHRGGARQAASVAVREGAVIVTFRLPAETTGKTRGITTGKATGIVTGIVTGKRPPRGLAPEITLEKAPEETLEKEPERAPEAIRVLRESGRLERVGPDKGGHWKVIG